MTELISEEKEPEEVKEEEEIIHEVKEEEIHEIHEVKEEKKRRGRPKGALGKKTLARQEPEQQIEDFILDVSFEDPKPKRKPRVNKLLNTLIMYV